MIYFISDAHLGSRAVENPREHEKKFVDWLDKVKIDAKEIYLMGDIFDFWFEYKTVVPKGFVRFLGKLAELVDSGIIIHFFTGNHDIWTFDYLEKEIGLIVHRKPETIQIGEKSFFLAHGDGLNVSEKGFKMLSGIFHNRTLQKLFRYFPVQLGQEFGYRWSKNNRLKHWGKSSAYKGENNEYLVLFAKQYIENHNIDYMIFGHRHLALDLLLKNNTRMLILGDFVTIFSYAKYDGENISLEYFEN